MGKAATYEVAFVRPGGGVIEKRRQGSPPESWMIERGKELRAMAVVRFFPSRKGWRILDIRSVQAFEMPGCRRRIYKGMVRGARFWPTKDAAIMVAIQQLARHNSTQ